MSYVIATGETSLAAQAYLREVAENQGKDVLINKGVGKTRGEFEARDPIYQIDFVPAATRAGLAGWLTMPLAVVAVRYSVFADNVPAALTPQVPNNACWVFYGATIIDTNQAISQLYFSVGNGPTPKANFDLQKLYSKLETDGYFTQPVVYEPQAIVTAQVLCRVVTGAGFQIQLKVAIVEPLQVTNA